MNTESHAMIILSNEIEDELSSVYEEIMWLSKRNGITASEARAWYTHIRSNRLRKHLRQFSGMVSIKSIELNTELRLEHYKRIQTTLTNLVKYDLDNNLYDPSKFIKTVVDCEKVHIVSKEENYSALKAKGDYEKAGIELVRWTDISKNNQIDLWTRALKGRVSNYREYKPT